EAFDEQETSAQFWHSPPTPHPPFPPASVIWRGAALCDTYPGMVFVPERMAVCSSCQPYCPGWYDCGTGKSAHIDITVVKAGQACRLEAQPIRHIKSRAPVAHNPSCFSARLAKKAHGPPTKILRHSRENATRVIFLITDGYSNGGDPRPVAASLRDLGVEIFTFGIWQGNIRELNDMASQPKEEHCYLLHNFAEFEALARRALHEDLPTGSYIQEDLSRCSSLCEEGRDCCDLMASCKCGTHTGQYDCVCEKGYYGKGLRDECTGSLVFTTPKMCPLTVL
ncbi:hypothetical protein JZ751_010850, partial [Albula glossodonta]